jgi:hypothetical protein
LITEIVLTIALMTTVSSTVLGSIDDATLRCKPAVAFLILYTSESLAIFCKFECHTPLWVA